MLKQKRKVGDFLRIPLPNGKWGYGRVLDNASYAIYDLVNDKTTEISEIIKQGVLFILAAYKDAVTSERWIVIGHSPLEQALIRLPMKFIQDELNPEKFELYDPNTGKTTPAKKQDCIGLERAAVWEPFQVEERIVDHFSGKPNVWYEKMKVK